MQPAPPNRKNRKPPVFGRCPICGTEFQNFSDQQWCSTDCARAVKRRAGCAPPERQIAKKSRP
jgi:hypothetical protein